MSQAQAKALRRTVRRSLGDHGAQAYQAMQTVATEVKRLDSGLKWHENFLDDHGRQLNRAFERIERLEAESKAQRELTFWGRMSWALTGH